MANKIRPTKLTKKSREQIAKDRLILERTRLLNNTKKRQETKVLALDGKVTNAINSLKTLADKHRIAETKLNANQEKVLRRKMMELFNEIELSSQKETIFQEGKKDTKVEEESSDRLHAFANLFMRLRIELANFENKGIVSEGFGKSCVPK
jgi:hypothetical protein